jgi:carboxymethylenebutenolidase
MIILTLMASLLLAGTSWAAPAFERELTTPASPLQVYNALTVDWQIRQWSGAKVVLSDASPGGTWRWEFFPGQFGFGGQFEVVERPERLVFSSQVFGYYSQITLEIQPRGDSSRVHIVHTVPEDTNEAFDFRARVKDFLDLVTSRLPPYLACSPGGYIARPAGAGPHPAVLLLHDRFGVNRTVRAFCDSLAASGYVAQAADMFRGEVTADLSQAEHFVQLVKPKQAQEAAQRAYLCLHTDGAVDSSRIAVWGVGFGTVAALRLAAEEPYLRGVVVWQGAVLPEAETLRRVAAPVFALFADTDISHPRGEITTLSQRFAQAGVRVETVILSGNREFSDPAYGIGYTASAVGEGWARTLLFLDKQVRLR